MENNIPTAEELLKNNFLLIENDKTCEAHTHLVVKQMQEFAKLHVKAALKEAWSVEFNTLEEFNNCYPLTNIK